MFEQIKNKLSDKKILILGFGKEGRSTFRFLKRYFPENEVAIADSNPELLLTVDEEIKNKIALHSGKSYLNCIGDYDVVIKSPGIPMSLIDDKVSAEKITSQTDLFLTLFRDKIIGITGTKGKSTTSSLIFHILSKKFRNTLLVGNIGTPPFDVIDKITDSQVIVFEMSSHQLENVAVSPHIAVLLNLFEEHLDHYRGITEYHTAKLNIGLYQNSKDYFVYNADDKAIQNFLLNESYSGRRIPFSLNRKILNGVYIKSGKIIVNDKKTIEFDFSGRQNLIGNHNLQNIMAAVATVKIFGVDDNTIQEAVLSFKGLPHRLEYLGEFKGVHFYNDSIATIPEATIEAVKTLKNVDTLILGGKDRGIDYDILVDFLANSGLRNIVFMGNAGRRIYSGIEHKRIEANLFLIDEFSEITDIVRENTLPRKICLLSPAASSYDEFNSFAERGEAFKKIAENL